MEHPQLTFRRFQRAQETAVLRKAWKDVKENQSVRVVLVCGKSGTGKRTLVSTTLEDLSIRASCFCGAAKFESGGRSSLPFAPLRQLLSDICSDILELDSDVLQKSRALLRQELSPSEQGILMSIVPRMGDALGSAHTKVKADITKDGLNVLKLALRSFFLAVGRIRPIVLCLDDLMWSDESTLYVLHSLLTDQNQKSLLFCATYRDDESVQLQEWIQLLKQTALPSAYLHEMHLTDLNLDQVKELLSDSMGPGGTDATDLAGVFYHHTHGNLFFMSQLLENLQATGLINFDFGLLHWTWDIEAIKRRTSLSDNVLKIVSARLQRLPDQHCRVLQLASCFGSRFSVEAIHASISVLNFSPECVEPSLKFLCEEELLIQLNDHHYKFSHDTIQLAAYGFLADDDTDGMEKIHWSIGINLMGLPTLEEDDWLFFACIDQLNLGQEMAKTPDQRSKVAELNLKAGRKAAAMSAFLPASEYLRAGIEALGPAPFHPATRDLAIPLHSLYAKTEYCIGHIQEAHILADLAVANSRTATEKESPYLTLIACYFAEDKMDELVGFCLDRLQDLEEKLPRKPNAVHQQLELLCIKYLLKGKSDEDLLNLRPMKNECKALAIRILCELVMVLHQQGRSALLAVVVGHMLRITLKHGTTQYTAEAFTAIGAFLSSQGGIKEGHRIGSIGEILLERSHHSRKELRGRAYLWIGAATKWWVEPIPLSLDFFITGAEYCMASGSIDFACHCSILYAASFYYSGLALGPLLQDVEKYASLMLEYRQALPFLIITPLWQCLLNLMGKSKEPLNMEAGTAYDKRALLSNKHKAGFVVLCSYGMQLHFFHGNIEKADEYASHLKQEATGLTKAMVFYPSRLFFFALIAVAKARRHTSKIQKQKLKLEAEKYAKTLRVLVTSGAINIVHKVQLLETELLSLCPRTATERVCKMYDTAIVSASRAGFLQDAAIANYLCFQFCVARNEEAAVDYLRTSHELWIDWNAYAVADSLAQRHSDVLDSSLGSSMNHSSSGYRSRQRFDASLTQKHKQLSL